MFPGIAGKVAIVTGSGGGIGESYAEASLLDVDLVPTCLFLLSDAAAGMTGQVVDVDGGQIMRP
jgi:NAD(P)-dependent dehydrogenase (short-subunit alcohol dehydrogenase family)